MSEPIPQTACPWCGTRIDRFTGVTARVPEPGDISITLCCSSLTVFDAELAPRKPTQKEHDLAMNIPVVAMAIGLTREYRGETVQ